jgi:hypothetical protein
MAIAIVFVNLLIILGSLLIMYADCIYFTHRKRPPITPKEVPITITSAKPRKLRFIGLLTERANAAITNREKAPRIIAIDKVLINTIFALIPSKVKSSSGCRQM